eukprot:jgi/Chlat1/8672/Chrsp88S08060
MCSGCGMRLVAAVALLSWGSLAGLICTALGAAVDSSSPAPGGGCPWQLVWSDEFGSGSLDRSKWTYEVNCDGGGNQELQCYTDSPNNVFVDKDNGVLVIRPIRESYTNGSGVQSDYTSGRIHSDYNSASWTYGRIAIRALLPHADGLWPAIWMLPTKQVYGAWAASGEIDIMEMRGNEPGFVQGTLWYGDVYPYVTSVGAGPTAFHCVNDFSKDFHVFALEWGQDQMTWSVDNVIFYTESLARSFYNSGFQQDPSVSYPPKNPYGSQFGAPFNEAFHLLLNVAVGGKFLTDAQQPTQSTTWPQPDMIVDYVRVYQRSDEGTSSGSDLQNCFGISGGVGALGGIVKCVARMDVPESTLCAGIAKACDTSTGGIPCSSTACTLDNANAIFNQYYQGYQRFGDPYCYLEGAAQLQVQSDTSTASCSVLTEPGPVANSSRVVSESGGYLTFSGSSSSHVGAIVGAVVGSIVGMALLLLLFVLWRRRRAHQRNVGNFKHRSAPDQLAPDGSGLEMVNDHTTVDMRPNPVVQPASHSPECPLCHLRFPAGTSNDTMNMHIDTCLAESGGL